MSLLADLQTIGRAPVEQHGPMVAQLLNRVNLGKLIRAARKHRTDPLVGKVLLALKASLLNPPRPPHALEQLGAQAD